MRLLVHVEGVTEAAFVNDVLAPHLTRHGYVLVRPRLIGDRRAAAMRGGGVSWQFVRGGILRHLKEDRQALVTTMVDYYGMPKGRAKEWPGRALAAARPFAQRAATVQDAVAEEIAGHMGRDFDTRRFIPYVSMHEFEALLFSDCERFAERVGRPDIAHAMQRILDQFGNPEEIDDSPQTAPSKRIRKLLPTYQKPAMGATTIRAIGLTTIRGRCANFAHWLTRLEAVATPASTPQGAP